MISSAAATCRAYDRSRMIGLGMGYIPRVVWIVDQGCAPEQNISSGVGHDMGRGRIVGGGVCGGSGFSFGGSQKIRFL